MSKKSDDTVIQYPNNIDTRVALLEQSIGHINSTLERIEKRFDFIDEKFLKIDSKFDDLRKTLDSRFIWLISFTIAGFVGTWSLLGHVAHWF